MAMAIPAFRIMYPDLRVIPQFEVPLAGAFNFSTSTVFDEGYWIKVSSGVAALIDATPTADTSTATWLTYPVITSSARMDVRQSKGVTVAFGNFIFETTRYKAGSFTAGNPVTVVSDAAGLGVLDTAASTDLIFGYIIKAPQSNVNGLIVQTTGWSGKVV